MSPRSGTSGAVMSHGEHSLTLTGQGAGLPAPWHRSPRRRWRQ